MSTTQTWISDRYIKTAGFVAELGMPVLELLTPQRGEKILDLGCGDGRLTEKLVALGCDVIGIDASQEMINTAQGRGLNVRLMDARYLTFAEQFDAVFSNAALHWIKEAHLVIASVWQVLKAGGRFVGEFGGGHNVAKVRAVLHQSMAKRGINAQDIDPWYFPSRGEYKHNLERQGFEVNYIELIPRPTPISTDLVVWMENFTESFTKVLPAEEQQPFLYEVQEALRPELCNEQGEWSVDYVRLRFAASKPA